MFEPRFGASALELEGLVVGALGFEGLRVRPREGSNGEVRKVFRCACTMTATNHLVVDPISCKATCRNLRRPEESFWLP